MEMNPWERRQKLLEVLCLRRHDTTGNLAHEFRVSRETIRRDIQSCPALIQSKRSGVAAAASGWQSGSTWTAAH